MKTKEQQLALLCILVSEAYERVEVAPEGSKPTIPEALKSVLDDCGLLISVVEAEQPATNEEGES